MGRLAGSASATVRIRPAQIGDANDVAGLLDELGYPCTRDEAVERISRVLHDPRLFLVVAEIEGAVCGLMSLDIRYSFARGAELARITALVVANRCSRQGIGRALLREAESIARQARAARIEVTSNPRREVAHAFYLGCGYSTGSRHFIKLLGD
ncbi:GNAT family N-acetyltransferase [Lysobacter yangpyeongensis]|uniref:GNAT family N-acetyltransferase n=1 Tax=Lysobacter yangpyeongensis TaxID=346182 RepID=A0ABW0SQP8_9GAMM